VVASWSDEQDEGERKHLLKYLLLVLAINVLFTILVFSRAITDSSQVELSSPPTSAFAHVSHAAMSWPHFLFVVAVLTVGVLSALDSSAAGLSIFIVALTANFILCAPQAPSFLFAQRYVLDLAAVYVVYKLRSKLSVNWISSAGHD
jgi:hypothetical protein